MRYKKTVDLIDEIIDKNYEDVYVYKEKYDSEYLLPYNQRECIVYQYNLKTSKHWILDSANPVFRQISLNKEEGNVFRLTYKKKDDRWIFDSSRSKGYSKLARINDGILKLELEYDLSRS